MAVAQGLDLLGAVKDKVYGQVVKVPQIYHVFALRLWRTSGTEYRPATKTPLSSVLAFYLSLALLRALFVAKALIMPSASLPMISLPLGVARRGLRKASPMIKATFIRSIASTI